MSLLNEPPKKENPVQPPQLPKPLTNRERQEFAEVQAEQIVIVRWPEKRNNTGIGLSINDGWSFGIGFGLAFAIALPVIFCAFWSILAFLGTFGLSLF